ncbi:unnamed protein product [Gongylonema pulchrum]|uniref:RNA-binding protein 42 n=1 Tax=Gongylonema pulchrum TaxID=637853 RepID=A0A183E682_9BILA|nr:unnamed protein product [Gongylonema pulchrum]
MIMRPAFMSPPSNMALRFLPPQLCIFLHFQLRLPMVNFMRPPLQFQPNIIESGPSMYEAAAKVDVQNNYKEAGAGPSAMKTQALVSDVEAVAHKRQSEAFHRSAYMNANARGEKKSKKRFLRCGGGQVWEDKSLTEWDPNDFRIFCGDLGNEVSDELLAKAFRKYPSFQKAKVVREARTNKSKGYGFVSFKHQDDFVRACREMDGKYVGNRPIKLRKSNWKERNLDVAKKKKKQKQKLGLA